MNAEETKAAIEQMKSRMEVMQAFVDGKEITAHYAARGDEMGPFSKDRGDTLSWDWDILTYYVKPIPQEFWINVYPGDGNYCTYSSKLEADERAAGGRTACIPVREVLEDTEHYKAPKEPQTDEITEEWLESVGAFLSDEEPARRQTRTSADYAALWWYPSARQVRVVDLESGNEAYVSKTLNREQFTQLAGLLGIPLEK